MSENVMLIIERKVALLNSYNEVARDAESKADKLKEEIKAIMTTEGVDTITHPNFVIRFIDVLTSRFDTKRFKEDFGEDSYNAYLKQVPSKRFTITQ